MHSSNKTETKEHFIFKAEYRTLVTQNRYFPPNVTYCVVTETLRSQAFLTMKVYSLQLIMTFIFKQQISQT